MAGVRPFQPPTAETDTAAGRVSSGALPAYYTLSVPTPAAGQGAVAPGFGGLAAPVMYSTVGHPMTSMWTTHGSAPLLPPPPPPPPCALPSALQAPAYGYWTQSSPVAPGHGGRVDTRSVQRPVTVQAPHTSVGGHVPVSAITRSPMAPLVARSVAHLGRTSRLRRRSSVRFLRIVKTPPSEASRVGRVTAQVTSPSSVLGPWRALLASRHQAGWRMAPRIWRPGTSAEWS